MKREQYPRVYQRKSEGKTLANKAWTPVTRAFYPEKFHWPLRRGLREIRDCVCLCKRDMGDRQIERQAERHTKEVRLSLFPVCIVTSSFNQSGSHVNSLWLRT